MCIILSHGDRPLPLERARFDRLWARNPHGGGVMSIVGGTIEVHKSLEPDPVWGWYQQALARGDTHVTLHLRHASRGAVVQDYIHPFRINDATWVAHNGQIPIPLDDDDPRSDTAAFVEDVLATFPRDWMIRPVFVDMVERFIGGSKLVVLTTEPGPAPSRHVLNDSLGRWEGDTWISKPSDWDWSLTGDPVEPGVA